MLKEARLFQPSDSVFVNPASSVLSEEENNPRPPKSSAGLCLEAARSPP